MKLPTFLITSLALIVAWVAPLHGQAIEIPPTDPLVRYVGRFDHTAAAGPRCAWSASTVALTITGGSLSVRFNETGKDFWQIVVNGQPTGVLELKPGEQVYPVVSDLPAGRHRVELVKRTEATIGVTQVLGFQLDGGARLLPTPARPRRIEVIGDSISCGYGNEAAAKEEHFTPATENAWLAYGAVAARAVDADYVCVAWSGKKLWPNNSVLDYYDRVLPGPAEARWDFSRWTPDVVIINLGTNDFNVKVNPEEAGWVSAYVAFIKQIRARYPQAPVYCALGTMLSDWPAARMPRTTILGYLNQVIEQTNAAGGPPVRLIDFGVQKPENGYGADWHPNVKTNSLMGAQLAATLKQDLGW
ncbi:MAG: acetylxylan esterase [Rariglobus sp.]|jgi:lysophospholipase L1-like esterase|nr:acetylxylan esterase [Rariglobus sp.]